MAVSGAGTELSDFLDFFLGKFGFNIKWLISKKFYDQISLSKRYLEVIWMQHKGVGQKKCWSPAIVSDWRVIPGGPWIHPFLWRTNYAFFTQESRGSKQCVSNSVIFSSYWELGYLQLLGG